MSQTLIRRGMEHANTAVLRALRRLRRHPSITAGIVLAFALGIGANAIVYGVLDRVLLSPPAHIRDAGQVRALMVDRYVDFVGRRVYFTLLSFPDIEDWMGADAFPQVAAYTDPATVVLGKGESAREAQSVLVTWELFQVLGVTPWHGRFFDSQDDREGATGTAVISWQYWQRHYGGDPDVLGETIEFGGDPLTIIGITPRGFTGAELDAVDFWVPLRAAAPATAGSSWRTNRNYMWVRGVGRLASGVSPRTAAAELTLRHARGREESVAEGNWDSDAQVLLASIIPGRRPDAPAEASIVWWLAGVSLVVLLVACINVANLLLARAIRRRRETEIRLALGIGRGRLLGEAVADALVLAFAGGLGAVALAAWGGTALRRTLLPDVSWHDGAAGGRVILAVLLMGLVAGAASALGPAWSAARQSVSGLLRAGTSGLTRGANTVRRALLVAQVALSVLLLVGAGLFVFSFQRARTTDLGFDADGVAVVQFRLYPGAARSVDERLELFTGAERELAALPGVQGASSVVSVPFWSSVGFEIWVDGVDSLPRLPGGGPYVNAVGNDYFDVMHVRILEGRGFLPTDSRESSPVAIVSAAMARQLWAGGSPIGRCLRINSRTAPCTEVVGVAEDARRRRIVEEAAFSYYVPAAQRIIPQAPRAILLRTDLRAQQTTGVIQERLYSFDPRIQYADVQWLSDLTGNSMRSWRLGASLFALFGVLALLVAATGLYSVLAFEVTQRAREMGIRAALGATRTRLVQLVIGRAVVLTLVGSALGLATAVPLGRRVKPLLFDTATTDPLVFGLVAGTMVLTALLAGWLPAKRAAKVDPNLALRVD